MTQEAQEKQLNEPQRMQLRSLFGLNRIETIRGIDDLARTVHTPDEDGSVLLDSEKVKTASQVVLHALEREFRHIQGLCEAGQTEAASTRLVSEYGPQPLITLLQDLVEVEPVRPYVGG